MSSALEAIGVKAEFEDYDSKSVFESARRVIEAAAGYVAENPGLRSSDSHVSITDLGIALDHNCQPDSRILPMVIQAASLPSNVREGLIQLTLNNRLFPDQTWITVDAEDAERANLEASLVEAVIMAARAHADNEVSPMLRDVLIGYARAMYGALENEAVCSKMQGSLYINLTSFEPTLLTLAVEVEFLRPIVSQILSSPMTADEVHSDRWVKNVLIETDSATTAFLPPLESFEEHRTEGSAWMDSYLE
jgi:hypothetical protein